MLSQQLMGQSTNSGNPDEIEEGTIIAVEELIAVEPVIQEPTKSKELAMQVAFSLNDEGVPQMTLRFDCICIPQVSKSINAIDALSYLVGTVGIGAGFLYFGAMPTCVKMPECGEWLAKLLKNPEAARWIFFTEGASGFGLTNFYFSVASIPAFAELMKETPSKWGKAGKTLVIIAYVGTQAVSIYFASETGLDPNESRNIQNIMTGLTLAGALPGQFFAATGLIKDELPAFGSAVKNSAAKTKRFFNHCAPSLFSLSENEKRRLYYLALGEKFTPKAKANWQQQLSNLATVDTIASAFDPKKDIPITTLFNNFDATPYTQSWGRYISHKIFWTGGFTLASTFTLPLVLNSFTKVDSFLFNLAGNKTVQNLLSYLPLTLPSYVLAGPLGLLFAASAIYSDYKIILLGTNWVFNAIANLLSGKPIDSLPLQLHPIKTLLYVVLALIAQALSYGLLAVVWKETVPENPTKEAFGYVNDAGIVLYHAIAWILLFTSNPTAKNNREAYLYAVKKQLEELTNGPVEKLIEFVETQLKDRDEDKQILGLQAYDPKEHDDEKLEKGELSNLRSASIELLSRNTEASYEKEESDDEEMGDETSNLIRRNISKSSATLFSKDNMPPALREKQHAKRCCSVM